MTTPNRRHAAGLILAGIAAGMLAACGGANVKDPIPPVPHVDVPRFMGDWYVIAQIPTRLEREAYDSVETYTLRDDGKVDTTFRYRDGGFDEKIKTLHPTGTVREGTGNAIWGMQFVWPIKAEYVIVYIDDDYQQTIVGRSKDLIISGGYNVYPKEIETEIDEIPGVLESAVIGLPHRDFGEGVTAVLVCSKGADVSEASVLKALDGRIAKFKMPKRVFVVDELPRNAMGKIQKNALRDTHRATFAAS